MVWVPDDAVIEAERRAHGYAREQGLSRPLYAVIRALATAVMRTWFRVRVSGAEHIPAHGGVIVAPNHKNFLDPFFIGIVAHRHVRFMAKVELFKGPLAWLFLRLGAFPIRRGEADAEALDTAAAILRAGGLVVVFPEGTRVEAADALGAPRHGAGRLAVETGAPVIPAAITGTSHLWRGALPKRRRVQIAFLPAVEPALPAAGHDRASAAHVWLLGLIRSLRLSSTGGYARRNSASGGGRRHQGWMRSGLRKNPYGSRRRPVASRPRADGLDERRHDRRELV